jgi:hypothetical protein
MTDHTQRLVTSKLIRKDINKSGRGLFKKLSRYELEGTREIIKTAQPGQPVIWSVRKNSNQVSMNARRAIDGESNESTNHNHIKHSERI